MDIMNYIKPELIVVAIVLYFIGFIYVNCSVIIIVTLVSVATFVIYRNQKGINRFLYDFIISGITIPINNVALIKVSDTLT